MKLIFRAIRSKVLKQLANTFLVAAFVVVGLGLSSTSALAASPSPVALFDSNVSLALVSRQDMANTQNRGQGSAKTKAELDRQFQAGVKSTVESTVESAAGAVQELANPETEASAQQLGNRARRDMKILKDTAEDLGPN